MKELERRLTEARNGRANNERMLARRPRDRPAECELESRARYDFNGSSRWLVGLGGEREPELVDENSTDKAGDTVE